MKKFILAILLFAVLFTSCQSEGSSDPSDTSSQETQISENAPAADTDKRIIASKDGCNYILMRSDSAPKTLTNAALEIKYALVEKFGENAAPTLKVDWEQGIRHDDIIENDIPEILIGDTNRAESKEVISGLAKDQYVIKWVNNKLIIAGSDDQVTNAAVTAFIEKFIKPAEGDTLELPSDLYYTDQMILQEIPLAEGAEMRVMTFNILGSGDGYNEGRREIIMDTVLDYFPDVIGFQESNKTNLNTIHLTPEMSKYYDINAMYHWGTDTANYTLIMYLKDKYTQLEGGVEWNRCRYTGTNTKSMSWTVLERIEDGQRFIVANIHGSLWDPFYELPEGETYESMESKANGIWHIDNAEQILEKVAEMQEKYGDIPVITVGDYNFQRTHRAFFTMKSTGLTDAAESALDANTAFGSYHSTIGALPYAGGKPIDHIFYSPESLEAVKHEICMRQSDLDASDHCPVYADFRFIK